MIVPNGSVNEIEKVSEESPVMVHKVAVPILPIRNVLPPQQNIVGVKVANFLNFYSNKRLPVSILLIILYAHVPSHLFPLLLLAPIFLPPLLLCLPHL